MSDAARCEADIPNLTTLGVNAVRVYNVNPQSDHAGCMQAFDAAGIYVIADLALPLNGMLHSPLTGMQLINRNRINQSSGTILGRRPARIIHCYYRRSTKLRQHCRFHSRQRSSHRTNKHQRRSFCQSCCKGCESLPRFGRFVHLDIVCVNGWG